MRRHAACAALVALTAGCGPGTPTTPAGAGAAPGPPLPAVMQPILVVDGVDGHPVPFADVTFDYDSYSTNGLGWLDFTALPYAGPGAPIGSRIGVDAGGYLPRRTLVPPDRRITLWPVGGEEEDAVRAMVYGPGVGAHEPRTNRRVVLAVAASPEVREAWIIEAGAFGESLGIAYDFDPYAGEEDDVLSVHFGSRPGGCAPDEVVGFCRESGVGRSFSVAESLARDPAAIRRVLAAWFLKENPLPGLMNADDPADELSPLERRTIRMVLLRPRRTLWPDNDQ